MLTQIIENRFKPTNIYRLLAREKERAVSQQNHQHRRSGVRAG